MEPPKTTASVRSSATVFSISSLGGEPVTAPSNKDVKPKVNMKRTVERERERERPRMWPLTGGKISRRPKGSNGNRLETGLGPED